MDNLRIRTELQALEGFGLLKVDEREALRRGDWQGLCRSLAPRSREIERGPLGRQYREVLIDLLHYLITSESLSHRNSAALSFVVRSMHSGGLAIAGHVPRGVTDIGVLRKTATSLLSSRERWIRIKKDWFDEDTFNTAEFLRLLVGK